MMDKLLTPVFAVIRLSQELVDIALSNVRSIDKHTLALPVLHSSGQYMDFLYLSYWPQIHRPLTLECLQDQVILIVNKLLHVLLRCDKLRNVKSWAK